MKSPAALVLVAGLSGFALSHCSSALPRPPSGPHTGADRPEEVRSLPETVLVQEIPPSPGQGAVWVDGFWRWEGRKWAWQAGRWQVPPQGAYYAKPAVIPIPVPLTPGPEPSSQGLGPQYGMRWMYLPGHWHRADGSIIQGLQSPVSPPSAQVP